MTRILVLLMALAMTIAGCENSGSRRSAGDTGSASRDTDSSPKADWGNDDGEDTDGSVSVDGSVDGSSDGTLTDGSEGTDTWTSDGSDDGSDATDGGCVPPPQYYSGMNCYCPGIEGKLVLLRDGDRWNLGGAPYCVPMNIEGMPCDPTGDLIEWAKCTCE